MVVSHIFPVTGMSVKGSIESPAGTVVMVDVMVTLVGGEGSGWIVSVSPSVVIVCSPVKVEPGGSMRTTEDPSGSVNVSTFEVDADGVEDTLDVINIGSTVNVELDMVRVSSPVTDALAGSVIVTIGPLGSVSVCTIKDVDPLGAVVIGSTVNVEPDMVRFSNPVTDALAGSVTVTTGPLGSVSVCTIKGTDPPGLVESDDSGEVEELILPLAGVLGDSQHDEVVDEKTIEVALRELFQVVVTAVPDELFPGGINWRTPGATGLEKEVPTRAARLDRPIICFNAISVGGLQWPRRTMANRRAVG